ncbi:transcriptional activator of glycolytic enzymes-domain-containing protein [Nemania sp. FL0916]|nr:transcriptional activator of glycolytic enzymes-domain-containing protein [Nemania sp. FL0916]
MLSQLLPTSQVTSSGNSGGIAPPTAIATAAAGTSASASTAANTIGTFSAGTPTAITTIPPTAAAAAVAAAHNTTALTAPTTTTTTTIPTATPTITPTTPTSTATPAPGPAVARIGSTTLKRPAASDLQRTGGAGATTPAKRRATGSSPYGVRSAPQPPNRASARGLGDFESPAFSHPQQLLFQQQQQQPQPPLALAAMPAPTLLTEDQLHGRSSEQLIHTILQLQTQHQQLLVQINAQFENINQQLSDLRNGMIASHHAAASVRALASRDQPLRSAIPPPPMPPQQTAVPPPPRPPTQPSQLAQTPTRANARAPPASPSHHIAPRSSVSAAAPATAGPPQYEYRTVATVEEVWKEYRHGLDGQPAIEKLDAMWGSRWRPEPRGRTWYSRRKVIWDKIKEFMAEGKSEEAAVQEVEKLRDGGTINKLIRMLQGDRKDKGVGDDGML